MSFVKYIKEGLNSYQYRVPEDKRELMFDFYMSTLLTPTGDEKYDYPLQEMKETLYPYLKNELLEVVLYSICSEVQHIYEYEEDIDYMFKSGDIDGLTYKIFGPASSMAGAPTMIFYKKLLEVAKNNKFNIVKASNKAFSNEALWDVGYGGTKWAEICEGWLSLNRSKTMIDLQIYIDHIYDLQHNNDTVLDKVESYAKDGNHEWINMSLEFKKHIKEPWALFKYCSYSMKTFAGYHIKKLHKTTLQQWLYNPDSKIDILDYGDKNNNLKYQGGLYSTALVDKEDNSVIEIHTFKEQEAAGFEFYHTFTGEAINMYDNGEAILVWSNDGKTLDGDADGEELSNLPIPSDITLVNPDEGYKKV